MIKFTQIYRFRNSGSEVLQILLDLASFDLLCSLMGCVLRVQKKSIWKSPMIPCDPSGYSKTMVFYRLEHTRPGCVKIAIENGDRNLVDLPSYKMVDLSSSLCNKLPEATISISYHLISKTMRNLNDRSATWSDCDCDWICNSELPWALAQVLHLNHEFLGDVP